MDTPTMTPDVATGQEAIPASPQGTEIGSQVPAQHQEASVSAVDANDNHSNQEDTRRASEFEAARQIKRLEKTIRQLQNAFERSQQSAPPPSTSQQPSRQVTQEELLKDPLNTILRIIDERDQKLKGEIPKTFEQYNQQATMQRAEQEGLRLIRTNSLVKADPEGEDRIKDILNEEDDFGNSLNKYSQANPRHAAQLALMEYQNRYGGGRKSQSAPSKAQMQTTATAVNIGSGKSTIENEAAQLHKMILANPSLMDDKDFREKLNAFDKKAKMEALLNK